MYAHAYTQQRFTVGVCFHSFYIAFISVTQMERRGKEREDEGSVKEGGRILLFHYYSPTPPLLCSSDYAVAEGLEDISISCIHQPCRLRLLMIGSLYCLFYLRMHSMVSEISNLLATKCLKLREDFCTLQFRFGFSNIF